MPHPFYSIYRQGFVRTAVCVPHVRLADPAHNLARTLDLARRASDMGAVVALFPELGLSAYSNEDLFFQDALLDAVRHALAGLLEASAELTPVLVVGAPLRFQGAIYNCALVVYRGSMLGIIPKTYLPNYREFYERRQFTSSRQAPFSAVRLLDQEVPFGRDIVFCASNLPGFVLHAEICEDTWVPVPPSVHAALAGATILTNLSASNITVGKAGYRRLLCATRSATCIAAYLYSAAGHGESTTDLAWDGYALIYENGDRLAEAERFAPQEQIIAADVDLERLAQDRSRTTSFQDSVADHSPSIEGFRKVTFTLDIPATQMPLMRSVPRFPYVPARSQARDERCFEAYSIQVQGLAQRLAATGIEKVVIGVSGGLDSTQALIVAARTMDRLGCPRENILAFTMPGFATSSVTLKNAHGLMAALGVTAEEIDIRPSCMQMFRDIKHPFADGRPVYDITFENVQAGERTSHLFRLANLHKALVLGTGDLSELALGWTTYGVGDQMSHYNVNTSVPKTLVQHLIRWIIETEQFNSETCSVLRSILGTDISPELVPADAGVPDQPKQKTEELVGPYDLQDFHLYYISRFGFRPSKVAFLALNAWQNKRLGVWPDFFPPSQYHEYTLPTIKKWLDVFLRRFFGSSQFKRSALPNGPKIGSGGSLSPRGDWRAPSDSGPGLWLEELRANVPPDTP